MGVIVMENMILMISLVMSFIFTMYCFGLFSDNTKEFKKDKVFKNDFILLIHIILKLFIDLVLFSILSYIIFKLINLLALYVYYGLSINMVLSSEILLFVSLLFPISGLTLAFIFVKKVYKKNN